MPFFRTAYKWTAKRVSFDGGLPGISPEVRFTSANGLETEILMRELSVLLFSEIWFGAIRSVGFSESVIPLHAELLGRTSDTPMRSGQSSWTILSKDEHHAQRQITCHVTLLLEDISNACIYQKNRFY